MQNLTITSDKLGTLENSFDFLDDVKNEKPKNKQDLWEYLDGFNFVNDEEVGMAVADFFMEEMGIFNPSYGEIIEYGELATEYIKSKGLIF